jgi:ATP-dependent helicase HrpB
VAVYDTARKRVLNMHRILYCDLVLSEKETGDAAPDAAAPLLAEQVVRGNLRLEGWDGHVLQWINRLCCLRTAMPELEMPDFGEEDRLVAITMLCEGAVSYKEIQNRPVLPILGEWLSPWQKDCLNKYAPKAIKLANGREVKLLYREDGTPVFGLKCQLLFGVPQTPTIAEGRIKCLVEVLAPNQRPYQITSDLSSFWRNGYPQMKKDLAGRYPRHDWPDTAPDA